MNVFTAIGVRPDRTELANFSWLKGEQLTLNSFQSLPLPEEGAELSPPSPLFGFSSSTLQAESIINVSLSLPFSKPSEVDLLVPSQLEDILPFELDGFTVTSSVLERSPDGQSNVLASVIKDEEIVGALARCKSVGSDPQQLASFGGTVALLAEFYAVKHELDPLMAFIFQSGTALAVCTTHKRQVVALREWTLSSANPPNQLLADIAATISKSELAIKSPFSGYFFSGPAVLKSGLESILNSPPQEFRLPEEIIIPDEVIISEIPWWAIGLALLEAGKIPFRKRPVVDLRIGKFSYHRRLRELGEYLLDEAVYIGAAVVLTLALFGTKYYQSVSAISAVNDSIRNMTEASIGDSAATPAANRQLLEDKVTELEEQLKGIGTLTSNSPLGALREFILSSSGIDVMLDGATYSESKLVIRGSVAENRMTGELEGALKTRSKKFCEVAVNPRGKTTGGRVGFSAEITLCQ